MDEHAVLIIADERKGAGKKRGRGEEGEDDGENVHLLPCQIKFTGPCRRSAYFRPKKVKLENGETLLEVTLRGRLLRGEKTQLPDGCKGLIVSQARPPEGKQITNYAKVTGEMDSITRWSHDDHPTDADQLPRALKWFPIAAALHERTTDIKEPPAVAAADKA